jgi:TPP-dependent pyruvate/acetoin dehydrogenase alpha subunit
MFDTQAYRTRGEIEGWRHIDPIERLRAWMAANHQITDAEAQAIESEVAAEIADAVAFAEAGTLEPLADLERFVLMDRVVQDDADDRVAQGAAGVAPPPAMAGAPVLRAGAEAAR